ncbi:hypothetical protein ENBRE01_2558, partial [Enteropsectra breve]
MKLLYKFASIVAAGIVTDSFTNPFVKKMSPAIFCNERELDIFLLSEAYSYEQLKEMIVIGPCNDEADRLQYAQECLKLLYDFSRDYYERLETTNYEPFCRPEIDSKDLEEFMSYRIERYYSSIFGIKHTKIKLDVKHNVKIMNLVFHMRHELFPRTFISLDSQKFIEMLKYYTEVNFDKKQVTDIYIRTQGKEHKHLRVRCDIVFGINLYYLLQKHHLIEGFKEALYGGKSLKAPSWLRTNILKVFDSFKELNFESLKRLDFIKPLFSVIEVNYHKENKSYSVDFTDALKNMQLIQIGRERELSLKVNAGDSCADSVQFLNLINEKNSCIKNIACFDALVPQKNESGLNTIYCSVLQLFPHIEMFSLRNSSNSRYNSRCFDDYTFFDLLIYTLLLNNNQTL